LIMKFSRRSITENIFAIIAMNFSMTMKEESGFKLTKQKIYKD